MRIPRAKIRLTAIFPLSWHPPLDIVRGNRRNALTGPVLAAPGAWRRPGRRQAPCPAGRTARGAGGRRWGARRAGRAYGGVSARDLGVRLPRVGKPPAGAGWRPLLNFRGIRHHSGFSRTSYEVLPLFLFTFRAGDAGESRRPRLHARSRKSDPMTRTTSGVDDRQAVFSGGAVKRRPRGLDCDARTPSPRSDHTGHEKARIRHQIIT